MCVFSEAIFLFCSLFSFSLLIMFCVFRCVLFLIVWEFGWGDGGLLLFVWLCFLAKGSISIGCVLSLLSWVLGGGTFQLKNRISCWFGCGGCYFGFCGCLGLGGLLGVVVYFDGFLGFLFCFL